jgi:hypothetical protein
MQCFSHQIGGRPENSSQLLRLFAQACLGVVVGVLLAAAIARLALPVGGRPTIIPEGLLTWSLQNFWQKPREKGFYLLSLVVGGTCSYFVTYKILPGRQTTRYFWFALILSVPIGNAVIVSTLAGASFLIPAIAAFGVGGALVLAICLRGQPLLAIERAPSEAPEKDSKRWPYLAILAVMTLILIPSSFSAVAARIGLNLHLVSFVIGPALYFLGTGLLPGIDYYTQYSIGFPWLFHFVMGRSAEHAVLAYVIIVIVATWLFYAHLILLLQWLYRSWTAAATVAFIPLILGFGYPSDFPAAFFAPSSSILRYPLLTVCALLTGIWAEAPSRPARLGSIALATGLSIFLETESGVIMMVAASVTIFLIHPWRSYIILPMLSFVALSLAAFVAILFAVFGSAAFQIEFYRHLFDAFILFGTSGLGGWPSNWTMSEWNWLYHFVAPGASMATIAIIARTSNLHPFDKRRMAVLGFLATSGLMLLAKYTNMSLAGVWQMSAIGPFSVLGWWCIVLLNHIDPAILRRRVYIKEGPDPLGKSTARPLVAFTVSLRGGVAIAMIALALVFLYSPSEARNPGSYGLRAWAHYPSVLKRPFSRPAGCARMDCVPDRPGDSDVALIDSRTRPGEQVAIVVDLLDWTYLLKAHRPPLMFFLPSAEIFTVQQLQESLRRLATQDYIFTPKGPRGEPYIGLDDFRTAIEPLLGTSFQRDGEGNRLIAWKRSALQKTSGAR